MDKALDLRIRGREFVSRYGQEFFNLYFVILVFRSLQPELARANEINHNIHLANIYPVLEIGLQEKIWLPFPVVYDFSC